jgi:hypothetical protein
VGQIFLSYSRTDSDIMQRIKSSFEAEGIQVWTDEAIEPGTPLWKDAIEHAIELASCVVVILSPDAKNSIWVKRELDYASVQNVPIIALLVRGNDQNAIPFALIGAQYIDIRKQSDLGIKNIVQVIKYTLDKRASSIEQKPAGLTITSDSQPAREYAASFRGEHRRITIMGLMIVTVIILMIAGMPKINQFISPILSPTIALTFSPSETTGVPSSYAGIWNYSGAEVTVCNFGYIPAKSYTINVEVTNGVMSLMGEICSEISENFYRCVNPNPDETLWQYYGERYSTAVTRHSIRLHDENNMSGETIIDYWFEDNNTNCSVSIPFTMTRS